VFGQLNSSAAALEEEVLSAEFFAELYAAEFGWDLFLCHSVDEAGICTCKDAEHCERGKVGKHPRLKGYLKKATTDLAQIRKWIKRQPNSNLAIRTGNRVVVLDIDPRNGGFESLAKLEAELGPLPRTHVARTGGGGLHIFFSVRAIHSHAIGCTQGKLGPGIDVKARGGYVVAAPSVHPSGNRYEWQTFTLGTLAPLPEVWLRRLQETTTRFPMPEPAQTRPEPRRRKPKVSRQRVEGTNNKPVVGAICNILNCEPKNDAVNRVGATLLRCQVTDSGMTNACIYRLASGLRNIPELADKSAEDLLPLVEFWFNVGRHNMSNKRWGGVRARWLNETWDWSQDHYGPAWDAARKVVTPALLANARKSRNARRQIVTAICNDMQRQAGNGMWFLACRTSMDILRSYGIKVSHMTTSRWMRDLVAEGFLVRCDYRNPDCPETVFYMTAEAVQQCEQLEHPVTRRRLAVALPEASAKPAQPDLFLASTSTSRRPLILDFSFCWVSPSIHGPLASLSFSMN
jgi:hypothetical protein